MIDFKSIPPNRPVLIAGPTASGKSALALDIAEDHGGIVVNADALQVFDGWRILTARPDDADLTRAPHQLYGHIPFDQDYSVGHWLREIAGILTKPSARSIIVGGTGLYFKALTEGIADIPRTPPDIRALADAKLASDGLPALIADLDAATLARIDQKNPMRVQRAWEVLSATGQSIADWQDATPPPLLPLTDCTPILIDADRDWLNARIDNRFDLMLEQGALDEARNMEPVWNPGFLSSKAIGASELIAYLRDEFTLAQASERVRIASHQYAKRQRTWFRAHMKDWHRHDAA